MGNITAKLFEAEAPKTVKNFVDLAEGRKAFKDPATGQMVRRPLYNGVTFHRVIPGFMLQTGDPTGTGAYDAGFTVPDEFTPALKFDRPGRLGMANIGRPNTGSCQFFITEVPTPHLNNMHTIFGQVVEGQDLVPKIAKVPRDQNDKPRTPVKITRVVIERVGPPPAAAAPAK
jgi:cyclophilin family peptidyl-prolyl cis-trans isomerase